jgi:putative NIF3 family GTP cyclohydrolase 1 type 2
MIEQKLAFARENGLTVWRCHDYAHALRPDIIFEGVIGALGWQKYRVPADDCALFELPLGPRAAALANEVKSALGSSRVLLGGDAEARCQRVALLVGCAGGVRQIGAAVAQDVDALITGEVNEWETPEYFRDASFAKQRKALLVVGHQPSEEAGMAALANRIESAFPDLPVIHRACGDPLRVV